MRISNLYKGINCFALTILAVALITSCQKQAVVPGTTKQAESLTVGLPPPPPVLLAWSAAPKLPLTNDIPGDPPIALQYPQSFAINGKGYVFGGITQNTDGDSEHLGETWEFDPASSTWSQKASIPAGGGGGPIQAENFVIGNSAYICNGYNNQNWQYDQSTNTWTQKSNIPSVARAYGTGMSINGKGYIGLGTYEATNGMDFIDAADWWQYDPASDTWTRKSEFPGGKREGAAGFAVNGKGYVVTGYSQTKGYYADCWQYDPIADSWTKKADFPAAGRSECVGLSGAQAGYVATGYSFTTKRAYNDCWQYVPATNTWNVLPSIGGVFGPGYTAPAAFSIGTTLYLGAGFMTQPNIGLNFWYYPHAG